MNGGNAQPGCDDGIGRLQPDQKANIADLVSKFLTLFGLLTFSPRLVYALGGIENAGKWINHIL